MGAPKQIVGRYQKLLYAPPEQRDAQRQALRHSDSPSASLAPEATEPVAHAPALQESFDPNLVPSSTIAYESRGAFIQNPAVRTQAGEQVNNLIRGKTYRYTYRVQFSESASNVRFGMLIKTTSGLELGGGVTASSARTSLASVVAGACYAVEIRFVCALNPGVYFLNAGVVGEVAGTETFLHRVVDITLFRVLPDGQTLATGIVDFACVSDLVLLAQTS
jgi:lipopolysaccharide transport system ATP-binding protein